MSLSTFLSSPAYWERLANACREKIERGVANTEVWRRIAVIPLVNSYHDVEAVLLDSHIEVYWGRFVVFITWLHRHVLAYPYWRHLVQDHFHLLSRAICDLTFE